MRINEVCSQIGLTKKAINWYEQQGLIKIKTDENGYRNFDGEDIVRLKEIHLLRLLDIPAKEIKVILGSSNKRDVLYAIRARKQQDLSEVQNRLAILDKLIGEYDPNLLNEAEAKLSENPVVGKLTLAFPGFWGDYLVRHFGPYLQEPIQSARQAEAYKCIVTWLDNTEVKLPLFLRLTQRFVKKSSAVQIINPEQGISKIVNASKEETEQFIQTVRKQREEQKRLRVRLNPVVSFIRHNNNVMRKRLSAAGYYDQFIPALRNLSPTYDVYCTRLEELDKMIME